jgi:hypothetical protein
MPMPAPPSRQPDRRRQRTGDNRIEGATVPVTSRPTSLRRHLGRVRQQYRWPLTRRPSRGAPHAAPLTRRPRTAPSRRRPARAASPSVPTGTKIHLPVTFLVVCADYVTRPWIAPGPHPASPTRLARHPAARHTRPQRPHLPLRSQVAQAGASGGGLGFRDGEDLSGLALPGSPSSARQPSRPSGSGQAAKIVRPDPPSAGLLIRPSGRRRRDGASPSLPRVRSRAQAPPLPPHQPHTWGTSSHWSSCSDNPCNCSSERDLHQRVVPSAPLRLSPYG